MLKQCSYFISDFKVNGLDKMKFVPSGCEGCVNAASTDVTGFLQSEYEKRIVESVERIQKEVTIADVCYLQFLKLL